MKHAMAKKSTAGEAAVDGLLGGATAGVVMAVYLVVVNLFGGEGFSVLTRFDSNGTSPVNGALLHVAVSGVYGALFGILLRFGQRLNAPGWAIGTAYGIALFALAETVLLPSSRSALKEIPIVHFAIAHLIYGFSLGLLVHRMR